MKKSFLKELNKISIENMTSSRGNDVPNQFKIYLPNGVAFQSYSTMIAFKDGKTDKIFLNKHKWDCSPTTGRYRNQFLCEGIKETRKRIANGEYKLVEM